MRDLDQTVARTASILASLAPKMKTRAELLKVIPSELMTGGKPQRRAAAAALQVGESFANKGRVGRAGAAFLLALVLNPKCLARAERSNILCARDVFRMSRQGVLSYLQQLDPALLSDVQPEIQARLETYRALEELVASARALHAAYLEQLRLRPPGVIKSLMAVVEVAFLRARHYREDEGMGAPFLGNAGYVRSPEDWASVASLCIADINSLGEPAPDEASAEVAAIVKQRAFLDIVDNAVLLFRLRRTVQRVTLFGYVLERIASSNGPVFSLKPPSRDFEKSYRNANIRAALTAAKRNPLFGGGLREVVSMAAAAEYLVRRKPLHRLKHRPFRRYFIEALDPASGGYDELLRLSYYEDAAIWLEHADWGVNAQAFAESRIGPTLTIQEFLSAVRPVRMFFEIHGASLVQAAANDDEAMWNSCIPVLSDAELARLVRPATLGAAKELEFWTLLRWNASGFLDLQYTPLVASLDVNMIAPRVLLASHLVRNLMTLHQRRVDNAGATFTRSVADELDRAGLPNVVERLLKSQASRGEVDIAAIAEDALVLFECKHSLAGASVHEHADAWEDVSHAAEQLAKCSRIIDTIGLPQLVKLWFPSIPNRVSRVIRVVLTSTRLFSGLELEGAAVRDWQTLKNVLTHGTIELAFATDDNALRGRRWSIWEGEKFSPSDLVKYFSQDSQLLMAGELWLSEFSSIEIPRQAGIPMLVRESFVANMPPDVDVYAKEFLHLGLRDLGPLEIPVGELLTGADLEAMDALRAPNPPAAARSD